MAIPMIFFTVLILFSLNISSCTPIDGTQSETGTFNVDSLKAKYADEIIFLKKEVVSLQERVTKLEIKSSIVEEGSIPKVETNALNPVVHNLNKRALRRRRRRVPEVAFQAALSKEYATFKLYDAIIFEDVITNIGGAYNKHKGIFTVPFAGTYSFSTNIVAEKGHYVEASIQVNGKATVSAISDHRISPNSNYLDIWDQGNAVAVLKLYRGDKVSVSVEWPQGSHDIHGVGKSSFSGYLLRARELRTMNANNFY